MGAAKTETALAVEYADDLLDNYLWPQDPGVTENDVEPVSRGMLRSLLILAYSAGRTSLIHEWTDLLRNQRLDEEGRIAGTVFPNPIGTD